MFKESYTEEDSKSEDYIIRKPIHFTQAFDDMSEIMTTIESMRRKPKRPQTEDSPQTTSATKVVEFDDKPDSFVPVLIKPETFQR